MNNLTTLNNKYKDRTPQETIELIKTFFKEKGCTLIETDIIESEIGTWSCAIQCYFNNHFINHGGGKGATKEFALASGYAELYEQFCSKLLLFSNPILTQKFLYQSYTQNNYFLDKNEVVFTPQEYCKQNNNLLSDIEKFYGSITNFYLYTKNIYDNKIIGLPYKEYDTDHIEYYDPRILFNFFNSTGLAAGNTIEEAYVQGSSEIYERYVQLQVFKNKASKYYYLNINNLPVEIKNKLQNIQELGYTPYLFDLSYNFELPVCALVVSNPFSNNFLIDFGSAPTFNIAAERTITELYQHIYSYRNTNIHCQSPYHTNTPILENYWPITGCISKTNFLPEELILNSECKDYYNDKIFVKAVDYTNKDLVAHYNKLNKIHNWTAYYFNNSLNKDIYAIHVVIPNMNDFGYTADYLNSFSLETKSIALESVIQLYNFLLTTIHEKYIDKTNLYSCCSNISHLRYYEDIDKVFSFLLTLDWFNPYLIMEKTGFNLECFLELCDNLPLSQKVIDKLAPHIFSLRTTNKYLSLYLYVYSQHYNNETIKQIFSKLNNPIDDYEINQMRQSKTYLIEKILLEPLIYEYDDSQHTAFVNLYIKK